MHDARRAALRRVRRDGGSGRSSSTKSRTWRQLLTPERMQEASQMFTPEFLQARRPGFGDGQCRHRSIRDARGREGADARRSRARHLRPAPRDHARHARHRRATPTRWSIARTRRSSPSASRARSCSMLPGLRHGFTAEKPDEINAALLDFLGRRRRSRRRAGSSTG